MIKFKLISSNPFAQLPYQCVKNPELWICVELVQELVQDFSSSSGIPLMLSLGIVLYAYPGAAKKVKAGGAKFLWCYKWNVRKQGTWSSLRSCNSHIKLLVAAASMRLTSVWTSIMLLHHCHNVFIFNHQGLQLSTCEFQSFWKF
jgi:hypothetical protein